MGTMMTYGSYFRDDQNIPATTLRVMCADLFVSMLAGIAGVATLALVVIAGSLVWQQVHPVVPAQPKLRRVLIVARSTASRSLRFRAASRTS